MFNPKNIADIVTFSRAILAGLLIWLGLFQGREGLSLVFWLMLADWTGDILDGFLARRSKNPVHAWIGDHDLEVDIFVSVGLFIYMLLAGFIDWQIGIGYLLLWIFIIRQWGHSRSLGMLLQAPIYAWFLIVSLQELPASGWVFLGWLLFVFIITWPRFHREVVPGFLQGIRETKNGTG